MLLALFLFTLLDEELDFLVDSPQQASPCLDVMLSIGVSSGIYTPQCGQVFNVFFRLPELLSMDCQALFSHVLFHLLKLQLITWLLFDPDDIEYLLDLDLSATL